MSKWQPIDTAPRDGTPFLAKIGGLPYRARYDELGRFMWCWHRDTGTGPAYSIHKIDGKKLLEEIKPRDKPDYQPTWTLWTAGFDATPTHWASEPVDATPPEGER